MTTLRKLQHQIDRLLSAGPKTKDSKLSTKYIQTEIIQIANSLIKLEHYQKMNRGERDVDALRIATYRDLEVKDDDIYGRNYIELPAYPENLPDGVGIQQVKPQTGNPTDDRAMVIIMPNEVEIFGELLFGMEILKDQFCAQPDRDKIFFTSKNDETLIDAGIDKVELQMVIIDPAQLDEDDRFPVSPAQEIEIIKSVLQLHGYTSKESADIVNDGIPQK